MKKSETRLTPRNGLLLHMTSEKSTFLDNQKHDKGKVDFDKVDKGKIIGISSIEIFSFVFIHYKKNMSYLYPYLHTDLDLRIWICR